MYRFQKLQLEEMHIVHAIVKYRAHIVHYKVQHGII